MKDNLKLQKSSKIFVAGGTGLVGTAIIKKLIEKGYTNIISNYHNRKPNNSTFNIQHSTLKTNSVRYIKLDLSDCKAVESFFKNESPEFVFLAAARVGGILANDTYKADFIYDNIMIAANIINAAYKYKVKKLLNLGSSCIYPKFAPQPMKEEHLLTGELEPTNEPYAIAKISAIKLCRYFNEQYGTNFISAMPTNLYGPNDNFDLYTSHVLPALLRKIHLSKCLENNNFEAIRKDLDKRPIENIDGSASEGEILSILEKYGISFKIQHSTFNIDSDKVRIEVWGSGKPMREFLYVDDMADACVFLMEKIDADDMRKLSRDYFVNLGVGNDISIRDLANSIKEIVGFNGKVEYDLTKPDGTPRKLLDVSKINKLGWKAKTSLEDGIKKTYKWYLEKYEYKF